MRCQSAYIIGWVSGGSEGLRGGVPGAPTFAACGFSVPFPGAGAGAVVLTLITGPGAETLADEAGTVAILDTAASDAGAGVDPDCLAGRGAGIGVELDRLAGPGPGAGVDPDSLANPGAGAGVELTILAGPGAGLWADPDSLAGPGAGVGVKLDSLAGAGV
jgi:hypothetical protein